MCAGVVRPSFDIKLEFRPAAWLCSFQASAPASTHRYHKGCDAPQHARHLTGLGGYSES
jgi:hypothetical protein